MTKDVNQSRKIEQLMSSFNDQSQQLNYQSQQIACLTSTAQGLVQQIERLKGLDRHQAVQMNKTTYEAKGGPNKKGVTNVKVKEGDTVKQGFKPKSINDVEIGMKVLFRGGLCNMRFRETVKYVGPLSEALFTRRDCLGVELDPDKELPASIYSGSNGIHDGKMYFTCPVSRCKDPPHDNLSDYLQRLIEKTEQFLRRMRWKSPLLSQPDTSSPSKETYGFNSTKNPPPIEELKGFEDDMLKMIQSVKFKQVNNPFLNKLKEDTDRIKNEPKLLIAADKTTNFYKLEPSTYNDLLEKNITKSYKKTQPETTKAIHKENKDIATKLGIDDRVDTTADKDAFITLKDHKPNFANIGWTGTTLHSARTSAPISDTNSSA
ncbi:hypothetical protein AWC38_SpisGene22838 [Stylophora pistillata]|uniref:CAP-Gly domain-containing protein n=1 Tax=Stylophora pistillata TaxID=50429 RepID=A0A2B4RA40_STYPI|nr:hypothetical protein AWC38_SpisGene22838 [Stylophora pistillata]